MWYAVYDTATGALVSAGSTRADPLPAGLSAREYAERPDDATLIWSAAARDYVTRPVVPRSLRRIEFMRRFTPAEREALKDMALSGTAVQKRRIGAFIDYLYYDDDVYLGDQYIIDSVNLMESVGIIAVGRAAQVLSS